MTRASTKAEPHALVIPLSVIVVYELSYESRPNELTTRLETYWNTASA
jgi:hypothetical protein